MNKEEIIEILREELSKPKIVHIEFCRDNVDLPFYANIGDAGLDIRSAIDVDIMPNETKLVLTGIKMAIPMGYEIQVRPRSGLSLKTPLRITNSPATIDAGYRGELGIIVQNTSISNDGTFYITEKDNGQGVYKIKNGDRIAQLVLCKIEEVRFEVLEGTSVESIGINRGGGYGSSGVN